MTELHSNQPFQGVASQTDFEINAKPARNPIEGESPAGLNRDQPDPGIRRETNPKTVPIARCALQNHPVPDPDPGNQPAEDVQMWAIRNSSAPFSKNSATPAIDGDTGLGIAKTLTKMEN